MSVSINVRAYAGKNSVEFIKHYKIVAFCIENKVSYPKETSEFFKGKVCGDNLEDFKGSAVLEYLENGIELPLKTTGEIEYGEGLHIKISDIPKEADEIIINMS